MCFWTKVEILLHSLYYDLGEFSLWPFSLYLPNRICRTFLQNVENWNNLSYNRKIRSENLDDFVPLLSCGKDGMNKLWCRYFYLLKCKVRLSLISDIFSILWNWNMANFLQCLDSLKWEQRLNKLVNKLTTPKLAWMLPKRDAKQNAYFLFWVRNKPNWMQGLLLKREDSPNARGPFE